MLRHSARAFVERLDFTTSLCDKLCVVVHDIRLLERHDCELTLVSIHPGVNVEDVRAATGWELRVAYDVGETEAPSDDELTALRAPETHESDRWPRWE